MPCGGDGFGSARIVPGAGDTITKDDIWRRRMSLTTFHLRYLLGALATAAFAISCSQFPTQSEREVAPTMSLVGQPDREVVFDLTVSGPELAEESHELHVPGGSVELVLPAGEDRVFDLRAQDDVYLGRTSVDLVAGEDMTVEVPVVSGPVVPDDLNDRIVQIRDLEIDDVSGGLWRELGISTGARDVEMAPDGRIWVATGTGIEGDIWGFDNLSEIEDNGEEWMDSDSVFLFDTDEFDWILAVTYHSENDSVYAWLRQDFEVPEVLYNFPADGGEGEMLVDAVGLGEGDEEPEPRIFGLAVHPDGDLLAVGEPHTADAEGLHVYRIDSDSGAIVDVVGEDPEDLPWSGFPNFQADITVHNDGIYVINGDSDPEPMIVRLNLDLEVDDQYGRQVDDPQEEGEFAGPSRFVAKDEEPDMLVILDQGPGTSRLVGFRDFDGDGWTEFGQSGSGEGEFGEVGFC